MKITEVKTILTCPKQNYLFIKIMTDDPKIYGIGDASLNGREKAVEDLTLEYLRPMLIGMDADNIEEIWQLIYRGSYWRGGNIIMSALCGIDMALWDIKAKRAGLPLYSLLGGKVRDKVLCYSHVLGKTNEEKIEKAASFVKDKGLKVIRLRAGLPSANGTLGSDAVQNMPKTEDWDPEFWADAMIDYFIRIREVVGREVGIIFDLHERFSPERAVYIMNKLEPYNPFFIEDPIAPDCAESLKSVREHTNVPIAFGELYKSRWECLPGITNRWLDFIRCDIIRIGGITEAKKIQAIAETYDIKTAWHGPNDVSPVTHAVNWHMNVSAYNFGIQEDGTVDDTVKEVVKGGPVYKEGYLYMEDVPGIGCDIDEDAARRYPYKRAYIPVCRRPLDGSLCDW